jgi:catalase
VHTDIIGYSEDGFPTRTGEEFLDLARALAASGTDAPKPTPIETFFAKHPNAFHFFQAPKPCPASFAKESFFGVTASKFTNQEGKSRYGRFRIRPQDGNEYLTDTQAETKSANFLFDEISQRLAKGPIKFDILVQIAESGDDVFDSTVAWPDTREEISLGTISLTERVDETAPEMRKIIFDPVPRVNGIDPSDDPLIAVRSALYLLSGRRRKAET